MRSDHDDEQVLAPGVVEAVAARPWPVAVAAATGLLLAVVVTLFILPERYTATASVVMADPQQSAFTTRGPLTADYERFLASAASFAGSDAVLESASSALEGSTAEGLSKSIAVGADVAGRAIRISGSAPEAGQAAARANAAAEAFDREHAVHLTAQAENTVAAIAREVEQAEGEADEARALLRRDADDPAAQARLDEAMTVLSTLRGRQAELSVNTSAYGSGVEYIDAATPPSSRASPNNLVNGAIGLVAGTLAGIAMVWWHADRRRALVTSDEPRVLVDAPLLGKVPALGSASAELIDPRAMPSDAYQFVASALRSGLDRGGDNDTGSVVLVGGVHPRAGATVTAANLAVALARDNQTVAVVDACADEALARLFGVPEREPGLLDLLFDGGRGFDRQRLTWALGPVDVGGRSVRLLSLGTGKRAVAVNELRSDAARAIVEELRLRFDVVIIDCGSVLASATAGALAPGADALALVVRSGTPSDSVAEARERLAVDRVPVLGYVFTHGASTERRRFRTAQLGVLEPSDRRPARMPPHLPRHQPPALPAAPEETAGATRLAGPGDTNTSSATPARGSTGHNGTHAWPMPPVAPSLAPTLADPWRN